MLSVESVCPTPNHYKISNIPIIAELPNEIIEQIFCYLSSPCKMALASHSFRNLSYLWYEWEVKRIQNGPMVNTELIEDNVINAHQKAIKRLHLVASFLYCNCYNYNKLTPCERYEWECEITSDLIVAILREYPFKYKTSQGVLMKMI